MEYESMSKAQLCALGKERGMKGISSLKKQMQNLSAFLQSSRHMEALYGKNGIYTIHPCRFALD